MIFDSKQVFKRLKQGPTKYDEEKHCQLILDIMSDSELGTISAFCCEVLISDRQFYHWLTEHELFSTCYYVGKMKARQNWEDEGRQLRLQTSMLGEISHEFEYWKMIGWSRYGVGKTPRIRLDLNPNDTPEKHYAQLLRQAAAGDFTASEIKQLMEAVNVGINAHQVFTLQSQIDELKSDLIKMNENRNVENTFTNKGIAQKD